MTTPFRLSPREIDPLTPEYIIRVFMAQYPNAVNVARDELEFMLSQYVVGSYANAIAAVNARKALGLAPRQSEKDTADLLSRYLHDVTPLLAIMPHAYTDNGTPVGKVPDPAAMSFDEYSSWRKAQPNGNKGIFD